MLAIALLLATHWYLSLFCQTFYLHRYSAHRMFTMSKGWERFFHVLTWVSQGSSYLQPRAYAVLHREHHAFSDSERDPHSPHVYPSLYSMMVATKHRYHGMVTRRIEPEPRFEGGYPEWDLVDRMADSWVSRIGFGVGYTLFYFAFAPHWAFFLLLPVHYLMGPIHGAVVNWCGHKYGYRNFENVDDHSRNTLPMDFLMLGELFQNNHHKFGMAPNFAARWFEVDPTYPVIRLLAWLHVIELPRYSQRARWTPEDKRSREPRGEVVELASGASRVSVPSAVAPAAAE